MSEWKDYKLGDIVDFQNGFAFKSSDFRYDGKYKIIRIKELKNGSVKFFEDTVSVSDEPNQTMSKFLVNKGDVIFALTGDPVSKSNPNSWVGRVSLYMHNESAYLNQRTCKITQRGDVIPQYVFYYFRHYDNFYSLASKATGSASQANISTKTLEDTEIKLPSLKVQTKIVNILSSLDKKIETNRKINARLEELTKAFFKSWFIDFEPFGGKMPEDWETCTLGDLTVECKNRVRDKEDVSVLSPISSGELVLSDEYFTKQVYSKDLSKYIIVSPNTFAYNPARINIGSIGKNNYNFDGCVSPVYVVFRVNVLLDPNNIVSARCEGNVTKYDSAQKVFIDESKRLAQATTLCRSLLSPAEKFEEAYFEAVRTLLVRLTSNKKITRKIIDERITNLLKVAVKTDGVVEILNTKDTEFNLFDEKFLKEVADMKEKNLALELLKRLLEQHIRKHAKRI